MAINRAVQIRFSEFFVSEDDGVITLSFPKIFCIHENYSGVVDFLNSMSEAILELKYSVIVDMEGVESITAAAALMLVAESMRARNYDSSLNKHKILTFELPIDPEMRRLIERTTLFDSLKPAVARQLVDVKSGDDIAFVTGTNPALDLERLKIVLCRRLGVQELPKNVFRAINEAFMNLMEHAYKDLTETRYVGYFPIDTITTTTHSFLKNRWWVYAVVSEETDEFQKILFLVYDMGHSIPKTIEATYSQHLPLGIEVGRRAPAASELIVHAFKPGITCTGKIGRGRGTGDMKLPLCADEDNLLVCSGRGKVKFDSNGDVENQSPLTPTMSGTLLVWQLHVQNEIA